MQLKADNELVRAIMITSELFGQSFTPEAASVFVQDLSVYPSASVLGALSRCRKELPRFPTVSQVIERIEDGRPGPEEAWAMCPKEESGSVVWTDEMAEAFGHARTLLPDEIAARMAFRESYLKAVAQARSRGTPANWSPSLGGDKSGQAAAVEEAVRKNRISSDTAVKLLPDFSQGKPKALLEGPDEPKPDPVRVRELLKGALQGKGFFEPVQCRHEEGPEIRRSTQVLGNQKYLTTYHKCPRCEAVVAKNFPIKEGEEAPPV